MQLVEAGTVGVGRFAPTLTFQELVLLSSQLVDRVESRFVGHRAILASVAARRQVRPRSDRYDSGVQIGIVGAGNIGGALAVHLARAGHHVTIANRRGPDSMTDLVGGTDGLVAATIPEALSAGEVIIEAVPFAAVSSLPADLLADKILVTASNYYPERDGDIDLGGLAESAWVATQLPDARVVKAFNTIWFEHLRTQGDVSKPELERRAILLAGDDTEAKAIVAGLIREIGFAPVDTGTLAASATRQQPGTALYNVDVTGAEALRRLSD